MNPIKSDKMLHTGKDRSMIIPEILSEKLQKDHILNLQFQKLSPGKRKEYIHYLTTAKKESTKQQRLQKIVLLILKGKGMK
ncbi:MAG TPA: YdeI/OmpD-associated family protein [Saprospiraceae bacterium]|nr:YdeI/OmpD-associated family protein [Saprospiraceae bacterium]